MLDCSLHAGWDIGGTSQHTWLESYSGEHFKVVAVSVFAARSKAYPAIGRVVEEIPRGGLEVGYRPQVFDWRKLTDGVIQTKEVLKTKKNMSDRLKIMVG